MGDLDASGLGSNWKRVLLNYDAIRAEPTDSCLFCLNRQQQMALIAILEPLGWKTRWYSPANASIDTDWLADFVAQLETELMTDHCDLATAITDIQNNITTINNTLTVINTDITTINNTLVVVENNVTNIENNITNITVNQVTNNVTINLPSTTYTSDITDTTPTKLYARYNALCASMYDYLYLSVYAVVYALGGSPSQLSNIFSFLNMVAQSWTNTAINALNGTPVVTLLDLYTAVTDASAVADVVCAMITYLQYKEPSFATFSAALSAYTPPAYPDNRFTLKVALTYCLNTLGLFGMFDSLYQSEYQTALAANPTGFVCSACIPPAIAVPQTFDFSLLQPAPWVIERGYLQFGYGVVGVSIPGDTNYGLDVSWYLSATEAAAIVGAGLKFTDAHLPSGALGNVWYVEYYQINTTTGVVTLLNASSIGDNPTWPAFTQGPRKAIPAAAAGNRLYRIRFYANTPYYGNAASQPANASRLKAIDLVV